VAWCFVVCLGKWRPCFILIQEETGSLHIQAFTLGEKTLLTGIKELPDKQM